LANRRVFRFFTPVIAMLLLSCAHGYDTHKPVLQSDNLKINSFLYSPRPLVPGKKYPGVVLNHGGMKGAEFPVRSWGEDLASKGFVVIVPQFRVQGGSEGHFEFARGEVDDSLSALEYLKSLPYADPGRIGMVGYSLGGLVTLRAAERVKGLKAIVVMSALSDPVEFFEGLNDTPERKRRIERYMPEIEEASPLPSLGKIDAPVLVMHGEVDHTVNVKESRELYKRLKSAGKDARLKIYPYANHGILWDDEPRQDALKFLEERLSP
jgi:dipeptidyl aminopeptidase/acylaminoacyl peptidase